MKLKSTQSANVDWDSEGNIIIEQWSDYLHMSVTITLTLEQIQAIENWVFKGRDEIEMAWNNGVANDPEA